MKLFELVAEFFFGIIDSSQFPSFWWCKSKRWWWTPIRHYIMFIFLFELVFLAYYQKTDTIFYLMKEGQKIGKTKNKIEKKMPQKNNEIETEHSEDFSSPALLLGHFFNWQTVTSQRARAWEQLFITVCKFSILTNKKRGLTAEVFACILNHVNNTPYTCPANNGKSGIGCTRIVRSISVRTHESWKYTTLRIKKKQQHYTWNNNK